MRRVAFIYSGQGAQRVGMGAALRRRDPELFDRFFGLVEEASGLPIRRLALEGPAAALTRTEVAQPALFALELALTESARRLGLRPALATGHSLGEYVAAVAIGALAADDAARLVAERGRLMAAVQAERPGAMGAVVGLPAARVRQLCMAAAGQVAVANLNAPAQTVVSGDTRAVDALLASAAEAGASRVVRLPVGAAFHSKTMRGPQQRLAALAAELRWRAPDVPLVANWSGELVTEAADVRQALIAQIAAEVRWSDCVRTCLRAGADVLLELGPAPVLAGLVRQVEPTAEVFTAASPERLEAFAAAPQAAA